MNVKGMCHKLRQLAMNGVHGCCVSLKTNASLLVDAFYASHSLKEESFIRCEAFEMQML